MTAKHTRTFRSKKLNQDHIKILNEAIRHNARGKQKDVHLTYQKENGEVGERKVRPLAVKDKSLFVAHCHERNALRSFRVERIQMVKQAFWDGFEKRAEEKEYLPRASYPAWALGGAAIGGLIQGVGRPLINKMVSRPLAHGLMGSVALGAAIGTALGAAGAYDTNVRIGDIDREYQDKMLSKGRTPKRIEKLAPGLDLIMRPPRK